MNRLLELKERKLAITRRMFAICRYYNYSLTMEQLKEIGDVNRNEDICLKSELAMIDAEIELLECEQGKIPISVVNYEKYKPSKEDLDKFSDALHCLTRYGIIDKIQMMDKGAYIYYRKEKDKSNTRDFKGVLKGSSIGNSGKSSIEDKESRSKSIRQIMEEFRNFTAPQSGSIDTSTIDTSTTDPLLTTSSQEATNREPKVDESILEKCTLCVGCVRRKGHEAPCTNYKSETLRML